MKKTYKFFGSFAILLILFLGSTFILESCKGKNSDLVYEDSDEAEYESDEEIYSEYFESDEEASAAGVEVEDVVSTEVDPEYTSTEKDVVDYEEDFSFEATEEEKKEYTQPKTEVRNNPVKARTVSTSTSSSAGGSYLVVAGSYLVEDNARKMVKKLQGLGYTDAEIVIFDESKYHSITAGRYPSRSAAADVASALKNKGIDCYVHTRK